MHYTSICCQKIAFNREVEATCIAVNLLFWEFWKAVILSDTKTAIQAVESLSIHKSLEMGMSEPFMKIYSREIWFYNEFVPITKYTKIKKLFGVERVQNLQTYDKPSSVLAQIATYVKPQEINTHQMSAFFYFREAIEGISPWLPLLAQKRFSHSIPFACWAQLSGKTAIMDWYLYWTLLCRLQPGWENGQTPPTTLPGLEKQQTMWPIFGTRCVIGKMWNSTYLLLEVIIILIMFLLYGTCYPQDEWFRNNTFVPSSVYSLWSYHWIVNTF